jgi:SAM-dependent methyltransferase
MKYPAFDYDQFGKNYSEIRQEDPSIAQLVYGELADCHTILNVGAGAGSYEPKDKYVLALEPSAEMRKQRNTKGKMPAIIGISDAIPFDNDSFDASMSILSIHHWGNLEKGLSELKRVSKRKILIMTFDPEKLGNSWIAKYFPEIIDVERKRYPNISQLVDFFQCEEKIISVPLPFDCKDGFTEAYYGRPEAFLNKKVREAQSDWGFINEDVEEKIVKKLRDDILSGLWDRLYGEHRHMKEFESALRILVFSK